MGRGTKTKRSLGAPRSLNPALRFVQLEELQISNKYVRLLLRHHGKVPCVILYTDEQISDIRRFCCAAPSGQSTILGVDKTFNLGDLHVTGTVFKYLAVKRRSTDDHPIVAGPMFLHGNSDTETFYLFFQHIQGLLHDMPSYHKRKKN